MNELIKTVSEAVRLAKFADPYGKEPSVDSYLERASLKELNEFISGIPTTNSRWFDLAKHYVTIRLSEQHTMKVEVSGSHNSVQIGNHNTQQIQTAFHYLEMQIDKSPDSPQEKAAAKSLLGTILNNPILASVIGQVVGAFAKNIVP